MARLPAHMQLDPLQQAIVQAITEAHNALQEGVANNLSRLRTMSQHKLKCIEGFRRYLITMTS